MKKGNNEKGESIRRTRFKQVSEKNITSLLRDLDRLKSLSSKNSYDYKDEELDVIINTLRNKINEVEKYYKGEIEDSNTFSWDRS